MSEPSGVEIQQAPAHPALVHEEPRWRAALVTAAILDAVALACLYYTHTIGTVQELAVGASTPKRLVLGALIGGIVPQLAAVPLARRTRLPWVVAAWAGVFVVTAAFLAIAALMGAMSISSVIE